MLVTVAALATTLLAQQPVDKPTLELYQGRFVIRSGNDVLRVPLQTFSELPASVMFRRDDVYAVWDERGLTTRKGSWSFTTTFKEFPTSSRFFKREEVLETLGLVRRGRRSLDASGISGAKRLGNRAYFLVRWDESSGTPWHEALVTVDLTSTRPKPQVTGRFEGMSLGRGGIDDRLFLREEAIEAIVQNDRGWGVGRYDPKLESFGYRDLGEKVQSYTPLTSDTGLYIEETSYGLTSAGEINLGSGDKHLLFEGRGAARFTDTLKPRLLVGNGPTGRMLANTETGAVTLIGNSDEVRRAGKLVLVWSPASSPKSARLLSPERWEEVASWKART